MLKNWRLFQNINSIHNYLLDKFYLQPRDSVDSYRTPEVQLFKKSTKN